MKEDIISDRDNSFQLHIFQYEYPVHTTVVSNIFTSRIIIILYHSTAESSILIGQKVSINVL